MAAEELANENKALRTHLNTIQVLRAEAVEEAARAGRALKTEKAAYWRVKEKLAEAEAACRNHHLEACESCAVTESDLIAAQETNEAWKRQVAQLVKSLAAAEARARELWVQCATEHANLIAAEARATAAEEQMRKCECCCHD